jgi:chromatin assembly factor 1 subunit B
MYANETYTSFFRRLAFTPEGSLLFTPAGQYKVPQPSAAEGTKTTDETVNTVYVYTRAGFNKPPIAHLPGHKKPSIAVKCSPVIYCLRPGGAKKQVNITIDTSSGEDAIPALPAPMMQRGSSQGVLPTTERPTSSAMEPPPTSSVTMPSPKDITRSTSAPRDQKEPETANEAVAAAPAFALPYRMVYAVATQDAVLVYDTQQQTPLCVVSNLHFATFTDLTWLVHFRLSDEARSNMVQVD